MKNFLTLLVLAALMLSCSPPNEGVFRNISVTSFLELKKQRPDLIIVDVRTPDEIAEGKIEGALEMDFLRPNFMARVRQLDKNKPILVYCAVGGRSKEAMNLLREEGFKEVYNLEGGIKAWEAEGLSLVTEP